MKQEETMRTHVKTLAVLQIVHAAVGLAAGIAVLVIFGGLAALVSWADPSGGGKEFAAPVLRVLGTVIALIAAVLSLPRVIAGVGLLGYHQWARVLTILLSIMGLLDIPIGTAIGCYGLWVLLSPEGSVLFDSDRAAAYNLPARSSSAR